MSSLLVKFYYTIYWNIACVCCMSNFYQLIILVSTLIIIIVLSQELAI
jgi:hypothetical protein